MEGHGRAEARLGAEMGPFGLIQVLEYCALPKIKVTVGGCEILPAMARLAWLQIDVRFISISKTQSRLKKCTEDGGVKIIDG